MPVEGLSGDPEFLTQSRDAGLGLAHGGQRCSTLRGIGGYPSDAVSPCVPDGGAAGGRAKAFDRREKDGFWRRLEASKGAGPTCGASQLRFRWRPRIYFNIIKDEFNIIEFGG